MPACPPPAAQIHGHGFVTAHQGGARVHDGLEQLALAADAADGSEVGTEEAAAVADLMTEDAGALRAVEELLSAAEITACQRGGDFSDPRVLAGRVAVQCGDERLGLAFHLG